MRLLCVQNELQDEPARSTLKNILDQLGFFYEWVPKADPTNDNALVLEYADCTENLPTQQHAKHLFIPCLHTAKGISGKQKDWQTKILNGQELPLLHGSQIDPAPANMFEFDIITNVWYHLNRIEESAYQHPDKLPANGADSILYQYGKLKRPLVDQLIDYFGEWLQNQALNHDQFLLQKAAYPNGELFGLALTHDVDFIRAFHPLKKLYLKFKSMVRGDWDLVRKIEKQDRSHWGFPQLITLYQELNWKATFFFIARYVEGTHFRYLISKHKLRRIIRQLAGLGHEIALHPSRFAFDYPWRYRVEKFRLQMVARRKLIGMRQHYLRGLFPGLWQQAAKLGLEYEASLSQRRISGFRSGTSRPYFPAGIEPEVLAIPTLFFENTLPDEGASVMQSLDEINVLLQQVKNHQGLFTLIWHTNHILQPPNYVKIWQELIKLLQKEAPFIDTLQGQTQWTKLRQNILLKDLKQEGAHFRYTFQFPAETSCFSLILPFSEFEATSDSVGIQLNRQPRMLTIHNTQQENSCKLVVHRL